MKTGFLGRLAAIVLAALALSGAFPAFAATQEAPDALIRRLSTETLEQIRSDPGLKGGDMSRIIALVDKSVMPNVNFRRMTAAAVGPAWPQATSQQQQKLQDGFKTLLIRTYSGALSQVGDQSVVVKRLRADPADTDVLVRTEVRGRGDPVQLDYRMEKTPGEGAGWKIYNLNVLGVWLVETYRSQFAQEINAGGIDQLIKTLESRNQANAAKG